VFFANTIKTNIYFRFPANAEGSFPHVTPSAPPPSRHS
jgi:hypothetical protein